MRAQIKPYKQVIAPRVAKLLRARLDELDMNPRELSIKVDHAYDHIRLIVKGEKFGSRYVIQALARELHMDEDALMLAYKQDKAEKAGFKLSPMEPKMATLTMLFNELSEATKDEVIEFVQFKKSSEVRSAASAPQLKVAVQ